MEREYLRIRSDNPFGGFIETFHTNYLHTLFLNPDGILKINLI